MTTNKKLSQSETLIMNLFWKTNHPLTSKDILNYYTEHGKTWKIQTINTYLTRMIEKGLLRKIDSVKKSKNCIYEALISKEEYEKIVAKDLLNKHYNGSIYNFFAALTGKHKLSKEETEEIEKLLK